MMRWRQTSTIVLVAIIIALQACNAREKLGAATPDRVVERYLFALETRDYRLMQKLQPENYVSKLTAPTIDRFGGHKLVERKIDYIKAKPTLWLAKITAVYLDRDRTHKKFEDNVSIVYEGKESWKLYSGRWYLLLGKDNAYVAN